MLIGLPLILLATEAGLARFFSPRSFPPLWTLLARQGDKSTRTRSPWRFAMRFAAGASLFMVIHGRFFPGGGIAVSRGMTFGSLPGIIVRCSVDVIVVWMGTVQIDWWSERLFQWVRQNVTQCIPGMIRVGPSHP